MQPPDCPPPLKLLAWLKMWGFEPVDIPGAPPGTPQWWRRNGDLYAWDEAPAAISTELAKECDRLAQENGKLKLVTPKPGILTSEFLLNAGGMLVVGIVAAQGQIADLAATLGPTAGTVVNVGMTIVIAAAGGVYAAKRKADKVVEADVKKQIVEAPKP